MAAIILKQHGFTNISVVTGGMTAWQAAGSGSPEHIGGQGIARLPGKLYAFSEATNTSIGNKDLPITTRFHVTGLHNK